MATMTATLPQAGSSNLHSKVDQLLSLSAPRYNIQNHRDDFHRSALENVTTNAGDVTMMIDPGNLGLMKEEMSLQQESFRKLKFTYLEQEAKRNFLFSITGDEPQGVQPGENEDLEHLNAQKKRLLKAAKAEVDGMRDEAISLAKINVTKHNEVTRQMTEAQALQKEIRDMELELARIRATHPPENRMTITQAQDILEAQVFEMQRQTEEVENAKKNTEIVSGEMARTAKEVQRLGRDREREEARAKEVSDGREAGDTKVDEMCRWLASSITFYKSLMGIKSVKAISDNEVHLEYDMPQLSPETRGSSKQERAESVVLMLGFDATTRRLSNAQVAGREMDIDEALNIAIAGNDVPGLVADVLMRLRRS